MANNKTGADKLAEKYPYVVSYRGLNRGFKTLGEFERFTSNNKHVEVIKKGKEDARSN